MKQTAIVTAFSLLLLAGCGGGDGSASEALDQKLRALEDRVETLEKNLHETRLSLAQRDNQIVKLREELQMVSTTVDRTSVRLDRVESRR
jgi:chromosome segregation ATPase